MDLLKLAKEERARLDRVIALLESGAEKTTAPAAPRAKGKNSPSSKAYWTPARRKQMSDRIKALNAAKKKKPLAAAAKKP
jgi:hypothetical protein